MKKDQYMQQMDEYFGDTVNYRRLTYDPTDRLQTRNNDIVRNLFAKQYI